LHSGQLRAFLLVSGVGALAVLVNLGGTLVAAIGVGLMVIGLVLSAPAAPRSGSDQVNWWGFLAAGTALALAGVPLELAWELGGGLLAAAGGALAVIGVALGVP
jgi:hypothetical protein